MDRVVTPAQERALREPFNPPNDPASIRGYVKAFFKARTGVEWIAGVQLRAFLRGGSLSTAE
jgi:hypothetical protein